MNIITFIYENDLRLRASRRNAIKAVNAFGEGCCCLCNNNYTEILDNTFQNDQNNISDTVERDRSAASQVILSAQTFLIRLEEFIRKMHFSISHDSH